MSVAFDAVASADATTTSLSYSHTCTGDNRVMLVLVKIFDTSNLVTGVTYNSVGATLIDSRQDASNRWSYVYRLTAPATGANNVVVSLSASTGVAAISQSYTGCTQTGVPDSFTTAVANVAAVSMTTTTIANNAWLVSFYGGGRSLSAVSGGVERRYQGGQADQLYGYDSNGPKTPAGSITISATQASSPSSYVTFSVSLAPVASGGPAPRTQLTMMGVG